MKMWRKATGHTNIVQLLGKMVDPRNFPSMVSEFCEQGDLLSVCACLEPPPPLLTPTKQYTFGVARFNYKDLVINFLFVI